MHARILLAPLAALLMAAHPQPAAGQEIIRESALAAAGYTPYWQTRLPLRRGDTALAAYLIDATLYVTTRQGELHVVDAITGVSAWARHVTDVGRTLRRPAHLTTETGRLAVAVTHSDGVHIFDRETADALAEVTDLWPPGSAAVGDALVLYVGSSDGHLYAIRWYDPVHRTPIVRWKVLGGGPVTATPALYDDILYFTSQSGKVYACTADRRKDLVWRFATEGALEADLVVDPIAVYIAGLDRSLYCLDRETGLLKWRFRFPEPLRVAPALAQGVLFQYGSRSGLTAVGADTGQPIWAVPEALALASRGAERTCVTLSGSRVAVLASTTGIAVATLLLEREALVPVHTDGAAFYAVTLDGDAVCYAPRDMPYLRPQDLRRRPTTQPATQPQEDEETPPEAMPEVEIDDPFRSRDDR